MNKSILIQRIKATTHLSDEILFDERNRIYTFLNPVSYLTAFHNKKIYQNYNAIFADGSILVGFIRILYKTKIKRKSFDMTSIAPKLFEYAQVNNKSIYIVASQQNQVEKTISILKKQYPNLKFAGYRSGYFSTEKEMDMEATHIKILNPDFLIVGMGVLMQEKFLVKVHNAGFEGIGFTCGGFIHQTAENKINYYPQWADKFNLRFVYRMYKEKHTRKRYLQAAFVFPMVFLRDKWSNH